MCVQSDEGTSGAVRGGAAYTETCAWERKAVQQNYMALAILLSGTILCPKLSPVPGNSNCLLLLVLADLH